MKARTLYYALISFVALGFLMISCDGDDNSNSTKNVEGHWLYTKTSVDVAVTDPLVEQAVKDYVKNYSGTYQMSYEFKNDKTFYYYVNYAEPIKGIYKMMNKNSLRLDDERGIKEAAFYDGIIYVTTDMKSDAAKKLGIDETKIIKAVAIDIYERGLVDTTD